MAEDLGHEHVPPNLVSCLQSVKLAYIYTLGLSGVGMYLFLHSKLIYLDRFYYKNKLFFNGKMLVIKKNIRHCILRVY